MTRGAELLLKRFPKAKGAVAGRELGCHRQTAAFQIHQKLGPGLSALAKASLKADQFLAPLGRGADQDENTLLFDLHPGLQIDAVCPDVDATPGREVALLPAFEFLLPRRLQPTEHGGRQIGASLPSKADSTSRKSSPPRYAASSQTAVTNWS